MAPLVLGLIVVLQPLADLSPAAWLADDPAPALLRANLGPTGHQAYARLLHADAGGDRAEGHLDRPLLDALVAVLARHTTTPERAYFALWDGYGDIEGGESAGFLVAFSGPMRWPGRIFGKEKPIPAPPPAFSPAVLAGPRLDFLGQPHLLFTGPVAEAGRWGAAPYGAGIPRDINSPNLMWPHDRSWFVTTNIDGTWSGVAGSAALIADLLAEPRLEVVRSRYDEAALR